MRSERHKVSVPAAFAEGRSERSGRLLDLSETGMRIEGIESPPAVGTHLRLSVSPLPNVPPLELEGEVVRLTETGGFAARFRPADDATERLLRLVLMSAPILSQSA
jgi:hypothetical protein